MAHAPLRIVSPAGHAGASASPLQADKRNERARAARTIPRISRFVPEQLIALARRCCNLVTVRTALVFAVATLSLGCGTVDLGTYEGVRDIRLDEDYFYCVVQPQVLTAKKCAGGEPGDTGGCHSSNSSFRLAEVPTSVACASGKPTGILSSEERSNYAASSLRATRDPESSPLYTKPTGKSGSGHKVVFDPTSAEAGLIKTWISRAR